MSFLTDEQKDLANEIAALLTERGETVCVAESTTGGLVSAALLWVAGASKYYAGGGVVYTLDSRTAMAGVPASMFENYRGTTPEMIAAIAVGLRQPWAPRGVSPSLASPVPREAAPGCLPAARRSASRAR